MKKLSLLFLLAGSSFTTLPIPTPLNPSRPTQNLPDSTAPGIPGRSEPLLISRQFSFTEGPAVDAAGNIFFTDQPNDKIWEYDINGQLSVFLDKVGRSNGMYFDKHGSLITCADGKDELWSIAPDKKITILLDNFQGHRLNGPNDCWVDNRGGIYFTDPYYQRPYWDRSHSDLDGEKVYYLPAGSKQPIIVAADLMQPNGIVGTPDGKYLYVADIKASKTYKYRILRDGSLDKKTLFVSMGSDGMTLDEKGDLYLTGKGVTVFDPRGQKIDQIPIPEDWTANVCFGGKDRKDLFITASPAIYIVHMPVKGVE